MTEFEQSGKLNEARIQMGTYNQLLAPKPLSVGSVVLSALVTGSVPSPHDRGVMFWVVQHRTIRDYRLWTLEQLALATAYLLGPNDPMLAGETTMFAAHSQDVVHRDCAVAVTASHVLILRIDSLDGQPRWVGVAAHPKDVTIDLRSGWFGYGPTLVVSSQSGQWKIRGQQEVFQPEPVLQAWRQAVAGTVQTG